MIKWTETIPEEPVTKEFVLVKQETHRSQLVQHVATETDLRAAGFVRAWELENLREAYDHACRSKTNRSIAPRARVSAGRGRPAGTRPATAPSLSHTAGRSVRTASRGN